MKKIIRFILILIFIAMAFCCFWKYIGIRHSIQDEKQEQKEIIDIAEVPEEPIVDSKVNFKELQSINSDIVAWIYIEGTNINYPILQNKNSNTYYLKHNYKKEYSNFGSIYMDATANVDFTSLNTFVYGHHTYNKSMFGEIGNFMNQDFFESHKNIFIYTPTNNYKLEIFSVHIDDANSPSYKMYFTSKQDYKEYIDLMKSKSNIKSDLEINPEIDRIVTLYSCSRETNYKKQDRYFIHGKITNL